MGWQSGQKQTEGPDHIQRNEGDEGVAEDAVQAISAGVTCPGDGDEQNDGDDDEKPGGAQGEGFRESKAQAADGEDGERGGPTGFKTGRRQCGQEKVRGGGWGYRAG